MNLQDKKGSDLLKQQFMTSPGVEVNGLPLDLFSGPIQDMMPHQDGIDIFAVKTSPTKKSPLLKVDTSPVRGKPPIVSPGGHNPFNGNSSSLYSAHNPFLNVSAAPLPSHSPGDMAPFAQLPSAAPLTPLNMSSGIPKSPVFLDPFARTSVPAKSPIGDLQGIDLFQPLPKSIWLDSSLSNGLEIQGVCNFFSCSSSSTTTDLVLVAHQPFS